MNVLIIEKATGKVVAQVPVTFQAANYAPSETEWFNLGWRAAVEDRLVDANNKANYRFELKR